MSFLMAYLQHSYFALFVIICIGYIIGNAKFKGISLDISAILFVALVFGHFGVVIPSIIEQIGLILFVYTIGIQAGPGFFDSFREQGRTLVAMAAVIIISASLVAYGAIVLFDIEVPVAIGLLAGALTSTPGLAAAIESTGSTGVSIGYGIAYPFGVLGVILFVRLYPRFIKADISRAEKEYEESSIESFPEIKIRHFIVENEAVSGKSLEDLRIRTLTNAVVSRVMSQGKPIPPSPKLVLNHGDVIKVVGTEEALNNVGLLMGPVTDIDIPLTEGFEVQSILISKTEVVNKTIQEVSQWTASYDATMTRVRRSGIDITPTPDLRLQWGDKVRLICNREHVETVTKLFGGNSKKLSDTDFFPISAGIVLGFLLGKVSLSFGNSFSFSLGLTGGVLTVAMILSRIGKTGSIIWSMSGGANQLLRTIGLMFFLSAVGTKAGANIVETYNEYGVSLFLIGGAITLVPMLSGAVVAHFAFKINILSMLGALTGSMTSTPGLAAVGPMTDTNAPAIAYATVYPVAMVLLIICMQLLSSLG
jgi:putative transport protein